MEVYETYGDYNTMRVLTQELIQEAAIAVYGSPIARRADADGKITEYDFSGDWPVKTISRQFPRRWARRSPSIRPPRCCMSTQAIGLELEPERRLGTCPGGDLR